MPRSWRDCAHDFPIGHELRYPDGTKYGVLSVCIRCRARRVVDWDGWTTLVMPPVPRGKSDRSELIVRMMGVDNDWRMVSKSSA